MKIFSLLSGEAEYGLERLHQCAEKELEHFLENDGLVPPARDFNEFRTKLAGLTSYDLLHHCNFVVLFSISRVQALTVVFMGQRDSELLRKPYASLGKWPFGCGCAWFL